MCEHDDTKLIKEHARESKYSNIFGCPDEELPAKMEQIQQMQRKIFDRNAARRRNGGRRGGKRF